MTRRILLSVCGAALATAAEVELKHFPIRSLNDVPARKGVKLDRAATVDGDGSLDVRAKKSGRYRLFTVKVDQMQRVRLIVRAEMKTRQVKGSLMLELVCHFPDRTPVSSLGTQYALSGTMPWTGVEASFVLRRGEIPDTVAVNVVIEGKGRFWIDDVHLYRQDSPAEPDQ